MMKELKTDEPYEVSHGCPTITFKLAEESLMLPWSLFASGIFKSGQIELIFQDWKIGINGDELEEVWSLLQTQDLQVLRLSLDTGSRFYHEVQIHRILVEKLEGIGGK